MLRNFRARLAIPTLLAAAALPAAAYAAGGPAGGAGGPGSLLRTPSLGAMLLVSLGFGLGCLFAAKRLEWPEARLRGDSAGGWPPGGTFALDDLPPGRLLATVLLLAGLLRLVLAPFTPGMPNDMASFRSWALELSAGGIPGFYDRVGWCDGAPGLLLLLYGIGGAARVLSLGPDSPAFLLLLKLPGLAADLVLAFLLFRFGREKIGERPAVLLAALAAFNPAVLLNSALWGQADSLLALWMALALQAVGAGPAGQRRLEWAVVFLALAVLTRPLGALCAPVVLAALIAARDPQRAARGVLAGAAVFGLALLPFALAGETAGALAPYLQGFPVYSYASLNAFNLYSLVGANWAPLSEGIFFIPYQVWGEAFLMLALAGSFLFALRGWKGDPERQTWAAALIVVYTAFIAGPRMRERDLLPAVVLGLFLCIAGRDRRLFFCWAGMSVLLFLNQAFVLDRALAFSDYQVPAGDPLLQLLSLAGVLLFLVTLRAAVGPGQAAAASAVAAVLPGARGEAERWAPSRAGESGLSRTDQVLALGLTLLAGLLAFAGLGSLRAPQTFYTASRAGQSLVADLGGPAPVDRLCAYVGLGQGAYTIELAGAEDWRLALRIEQPDRFGYVEWRSGEVAGRARYLRLTAERPGLMLGEIGLFGPDGRLLPAPARAPGMEALFDEPGAIPRAPGPGTGMYFDEIYFARSAWEILLDRPATETTHPPLGKLLIGGGILLFGVTPFGWRFAGALAGTLAVPLLYLLARRLLRRTEVALAAALLFLFDFMRFVQSRMATVDIFVLLFTLLAFYWMYSFWRLDLYRPEGRRQALLFLLAAGAGLGAGAACKWSAMYAAAGAGLLFAASAWRHVAVYRQARRLPFFRVVAVGLAGAEEGEEIHLEPAAAVVRRFPGVAGSLLLGGAACLVVLPAAIYLASYLPQLLRHGGTLAEVAARQVEMFGFLSLAGKARGYASPWWQWPLIVRPIWLYQGLVDVPADAVSSIVTLGNPAVWWGGALALLATATVVWWKGRKAGAFILIGFFSQFLPWLIAPHRLTFIYQFLPAVPFLALAAGYLLGLLEKRAAAGPGPAGRPAAGRTGPRLRGLLWAWVGAAGLLFALYYPLLTGLVVPRTYAGLLRWLKTWIFYL